MAGKRLLKQGERRRKAILRFIEKYHAKYHSAPTIQEIADAVGLKSPNATRAHLFQLRDAGLITMRPKVARSIALVPQPVDAERKAS